MCTQGGPAPAPPGPSFSFIGNFSVWEPSVFSPFTNLFSLSCIRAESGLVLCFELFFLLEDLFRPRPPSWWGVSTSHSLAPQVALGSPCPRLAPALQSAAPARAWGPALGSRPAPALRWAHPCQSSGSGPGVTSCPPPPCWAAPHAGAQCQDPGSGRQAHLLLGAWFSLPRQLEAAGAGAHSSTLTVGLCAPLTMSVSLHLCPRSGTREFILTIQSAPYHVGTPASSSP